MSRGLVVLIVSLGAVPSFAQEAQPTERVLKCLPDVCFAGVPDDVGTIRLCVQDSDLAGSRTPGRRVRSVQPKIRTRAGTEITIGAARTDGLRCTVVAAPPDLVLVDADRSRPIRLVPTSFIDAAGPAERSWVSLDSDDGAGNLLSVDWETPVGRAFESQAEVVEEPEAPLVVTISPMAVKERVPEPATAARPETSTPDDRAYLDVVAILDGTAHCTGVLIAPDAVLTAAHCLPATQVAIAIQTTKALHTAGVRSSIAHPTLDAAVLRLDTKVRLVQRPRRRALDRVPPNGLVRMIGFGVDDPKSGAGFGTKRRADVPVRSWGCDEGRATSSGCLLDAEMVVAGVGGRDTCWGDSGGPVLEPFGDTWRLIAITSRPTLRAGAACGRGGIYVRVDVLDNWITSVLEEK